MVLRSVVPLAFVAAVFSQSGPGGPGGPQGGPPPTGQFAAGPAATAGGGFGGGFGATNTPRDRRPSFDDNGNATAPPDLGAGYRPLPQRQADLSYLNGSTPSVKMEHPPPNFTYDNCKGEPMTQILVKFRVDHFPTGPGQGKVVVYVGSTKYFEGGCTKKNLTNPWQMFMGLPADGSRTPFEVKCSVRLQDCTTEQDLIEPVVANLRIHSKKKFVYLVHHNTELNLNKLTSELSDVVQVIIQKPPKEMDSNTSLMTMKTTHYRPNATANSARNYLLELARKSGVCYQYYIFKDADAELMHTDGYGHSNENEYRTLEKYLLEWEPAVASPYKIDTDGPSTGTSAVDVNQPVQVGVSHNKGIVALHHEAADVLLPWVQEWDHQNWRHSDQVIDLLCLYLYNVNCLQLNGLTLKTLSRQQLENSRKNQNHSAMYAEDWGDESFIDDAQSRMTVPGVYAQARSLPIEFAKPMVWLVAGLKDLQRVMTMVHYINNSTLNAEPSTKLDTYKMNDARVAYVDICHSFWANKTEQTAEWCQFYDEQVITFDSVMRLVEMLGSEFMNDRFAIRNIEDRLTQLETRLEQFVPGTP